MADFTALKTAIQNAIKQNGNEEITGAILQEVMLAVVSTLGDSAINDLVAALSTEVTNRQNADGTLQTNIDNEATARGNADTALGTRIDNEVTARENADTALSNRITAITDAIDNGYVYAGIATTSTEPATGKVFYLTTATGVFTNFGGITVNTKGIKILKMIGSTWMSDTVIVMDDTPTENSTNLVKSGGVYASIASVLSKIAEGYLYVGIATAATNPSTPTTKVFYIATAAGTYTNFLDSSSQPLVLTQGINFLKYNGTSWASEQVWGVNDEPTPSSNNLVKSGGAFDFVMKNGSAFDLTAYNNGTTYADLNAALTALNALPAAYKKGGMSMKYVQTSDNKYIQARCMAQNFTTDVTQWQVVDDEPTAGSNNLINSGSVAKIEQIVGNFGALPFLMHGYALNDNLIPTYQPNNPDDWSLIRYDNVKQGETVSLFNIRIVGVTHIDNSGVYTDLNNDKEWDGNYWNIVSPAEGTIYVSLYNDVSQYTKSYLLNFFGENGIKRSGKISTEIMNNAINIAQLKNEQDAMAMAMLIGGTKGKNLTNKTLYSTYNQGILKRNGQIDAGHEDAFFYTDMICRNGDLTQQVPLVIECNLMNIQSFYATVFLYDSNNELVASFNLTGKQTLLLDPYYKIKLCSTNSDKGTIYIGEPSNLVGNDYINTGSIVWIGTSIPAGAGYPEDVQNACGYRVYNQAIGSSPLVGEDSILALALSMQEKIALGIADSGDTQAENSSYENRLIPYVNGTIASVNALVFDHGYNDSYILYQWFKDKCIEKGLITQESDFRNQDGSFKTELVDQIDDSWIDWQPLKTTWTAQEKNGDFFSSFNFLRYTLLSTNPYLKIIMVSHLENKSCVLDYTASWSGMLGKLVCKCQQVIAEHYSFAFINIAELTGWSKVTAMPGSTRQIVDDYNQATGKSALVYWINTNGEISTFQYFCPDGIHPQSDLSGHTRKYLSQLFIRELDKLI